MMLPAPDWMRVKCATMHRPMSVMGSPVQIGLSLDVA
jgi:hypothetical protein